MRPLFKNTLLFVKNLTPFLLHIICFLSAETRFYAQEIEFKRTSIKTGIGLGFNEGREESGVGLIYSIGWQKKYGEQNRLRLNPNMIIGGFFSYIGTDTRDQQYRITSLGYNVHYDLFKYNSLSIVTTAGAFINYSRGLMGTGGDRSFTNPHAHSEYFNSFYFGGNISFGIRIDSNSKKVAYEIRPINAQVGNNYFALTYFMFGMDFKLKK